MTTPERKLRDRLTKMMLGKEVGPGEGLTSTIGELAGIAEFELEKQLEAHRKKSARLKGKKWPEWEQEIARWEKLVKLLRHDKRLASIQVTPSPGAFETLKRDVLGDAETLQGLLEFEAEMRGLGCPSIHLTGTDGPPAIPHLSAFGENDSYFRALRGSGGRGSHSVVPWTPVPACFSFMPRPRGADWRDLPWKTTESNPRLLARGSPLRSLMPEAASYTVLMIGAAIYDRALYDVKAGGAHRLASEIVKSASTCADRMAGERMRCAVCDEYEFETGRPLVAEFVVCAPDEGSGIAEPIYAVCAGLDGKTKLAKLRASLLKRHFSETRRS